MLIGLAASLFLSMSVFVLLACVLCLSLCLLSSWPLCHCMILSVSVSVYVSVAVWLCLSLSWYMAWYFVIVFFWPCSSFDERDCYLLRRVSVSASPCVSVLMLRLISVSCRFVALSFCLRFCLALPSCLLDYFFGFPCPCLNPNHGCTFLVVLPWVIIF